MKRSTPAFFGPQTTLCFCLLLLLALGFAVPAAAQVACPAGQDCDCQDCDVKSCRPECGITSGAQQSCPYQVFGSDQKNPREVQPGKDGILRLEFVTRVVNPACVPTFGLTGFACTPGNCPGGCDAKGNCTAGQQWNQLRFPLRMYGTSLDSTRPIDPDNADDSNTIYTYPGPTMRVRKSSAPGKTDGTRLKLKLYNRLPYQDYPGDPNKCNPQCVVEPPKPNGAADPVKFPNGELVCQVAPDCFHGDNATNLHFHGTHISPQEHSDFVLLTLLPKGAEGGKAHMHPHGATEIGDYWYDINPIPWNQSEGTHWYHPHKHGSTAEQVLNGMAGALIIEGPFDDWLNGYYGVPGGGQGDFEKVLVLQQVWPDVNFYNPNHLAIYPPTLLVNGQGTPVIRMKPGETQRWRFINATMQAGAQLELALSDGLTWRQIAQDGVRFADVNYLCQPLYGNQPDALPPLTPAAKELCAKIFPPPTAQVMQSIPFSPGNRADFLVQAPMKKGTYQLMHQVVGGVHQNVRQKLDERAKALRAGASGLGDTLMNLMQATSAGSVTAGVAAPLFTIVVEGPAVEMPDFPKTAIEDPVLCKKDPKQCWPAMPSFLKDLDPGTAVDRPTVAFSMEGTAPGVQPNRFTIDGDGYCPGCASQTMILGTTENWTVTNDSPLAHPFHIHINPFQLTGYSNSGLEKSANQATVALPKPWIWWDTVGLPVPSSDATYSPDAPACSAGNPCMQFTSKFEDFTGEYVLHCHFLGHEDRGMMENVQVVCPNRPTEFGNPVAGQPDNCTTGPFQDASCDCKDPDCYTNQCSADAMGHGGGHGGGKGGGKGTGHGH